MKKIESYISSDNKIFENEKECLEHEKNLIINSMFSRKINTNRIGYLIDNKKKDVLNFINDEFIRVINENIDDYVRNYYLEKNDIQTQNKINSNSNTKTSKKRIASNDE